MTSARPDAPVALITGGGGMIGQAVARRMAGDGMHVALVDMQTPDAIGPYDKGYAADLADAEDIKRVVADVLDNFGRIDCLITAAGVTSLGAFGDISLEEWDRVHAINVRGVFLINQRIAAIMRAQASGRIVNIGSVLAKNGGNPRPWFDVKEQHNAGNAAYGAAKAGVHALSLYLAKEMAAHGVTVNVVAPGPIASPMTATFPKALVDQIPVGRMGQGHEVAGAVAWLCGPDAAFVTGEIIDVNGGLWMD